MRPLIAAPLVLALSSAVLAAEVAEGGRTRPSEERQRLDLPLPFVKTPPVDRALDGLARLRLQPAKDLLDVSETARQHPESPAE